MDRILATVETIHELREATRNGRLHLLMQPWNIVFLVGFIAYVIIRGVFERCSKGNEKAVSRSDRGELILMVIMAIGSMILPILYLFTSFLGSADYQLHSFVQ